MCVRACVRVCVCVCACACLCEVIDFVIFILNAYHDRVFICSCALLLPCDHGCTLNPSAYVLPPPQAKVRSTYNALNLEFKIDER